MALEFPIELEFRNQSVSDDGVETPYFHGILVSIRILVCVLNKLLTTVCQGDVDTLQWHNTEKGNEGNQRIVRRFV